MKYCLIKGLVQLTTAPFKQTSPYCVRNIFTEHSFLIVLENWFWMGPLGFQGGAQGGPGGPMGAHGPPWGPRALGPGPRAPDPYMVPRAL